MCEGSWFVLGPGCEGAGVWGGLGTVVGSAGVLGHAMEGLPHCTGMYNTYLWCILLGC